MNKRTVLIIICIYELVVIIGLTAFIFRDLTMDSGYEARLNNAISIISDQTHLQIDPSHSDVLLVDLGDTGISTIFLETWDGDLEDQLEALSQQYVEWDHKPHTQDNAAAFANNTIITQFKAFYALLDIDGGSFDWTHVDHTVKHSIVCLVDIDTGRIAYYEFYD